MHRWAVMLLLACWAGAGGAAEREVILLGVTNRVGEVPAGFRSALSGEGPVGRWEMVEAEVPSLMPALAGGAVESARRPVLAQLSADPTDERFPVLIYEGERFGDFDVRTRVKLVGGEVEQMAGLVFRWQDERNYYYVRASALGDTFAFFKVQDGVRSAPIGVRTNIEAGVWHTLGVRCEGSRIQVTWNGIALIPELNDTTFAAGQIGFWTKSDALSQFTDAVVRYRPRVTLAQRLVDEALEQYPRLEGLKILAGENPEQALRVVASDEAAEVGEVSRPEEVLVIKENRPYMAKSGRQVTVSMPLHDRNGEPVAVARILLKRFPGQTEKNALARATLIVQAMESRILEPQDLWR